MNGWGILFGGLAGVVISGVWHWWMQRQRMRVDLVIEVVAWMDQVASDAHDQVWSLDEDKPKFYEKQWRYLTLCAAHGLRTKIHMIFGDESLNSMVDHLRQEAFEVAEFIAAKAAVQAPERTDVDTAQDELTSILRGRLNPLRTDIEKVLFKKVRPFARFPFVEH